MMDVVTQVALALLALSIGMALYRVVVGPSIPDRVVALDTVTVNVIAAIVIYSIRSRTLDYIDAALVIAALSFVSTVVVAKFIEKGEIIDRDRD